MERRPGEGTWFGNQQRAEKGAGRPPWDREKGTGDGKLREFTFCEGTRGTRKLKEPKELSSKTNGWDPIRGKSGRRQWSSKARIVPQPEQEAFRTGSGRTKGN